MHRGHCVDLNGMGEEARRTVARYAGAAYAKDSRLPLGIVRGLEAGFVVTPNQHEDPDEHHWC